MNKIHAKTHRLNNDNNRSLFGYKTFQIHLFADVSFKFRLMISRLFMTVIEYEITTRF